MPKKPGTWLDALGSAAQNSTPEDFAAASAPQCVAGNAAVGAHFEGAEASGHFYGAAIIEAWLKMFRV